MFFVLLMLFMEIILRFSHHHFLCYFLYRSCFFPFPTLRSLLSPSLLFPSFLFLHLLLLNLLLSPIPFLSLSAALLLFRPLSLDFFCYHRLSLLPSPSTPHSSAIARTKMNFLICRINVICPPFALRNV